MSRTQSSRGVQRARKRAPESESQIQEALAQEFYSIVRRALSGFGVSRVRQRKALKRAFASARAPYASGSVRKRFQAIGSLLSYWCTDERYVGADGRACTLPIRGRDSSFESLARMFLPELPLREALKLVLDHAEVTLRPRARVAVTGNLMVNISKSRVACLAQAIRHVDYLLKTMQEGYARSSEPTALKKFDRMLAVKIPKAIYDDAVNRLRPEMSDLLERTIAVLARENRGRESQDSTVLIVGAYAAREDNLDRLGYVKPDSKTRPRAARAIVAAAQ
jgi:hypothetical protein